MLVDSVGTRTINGQQLIHQYVSYYPDSLFMINNPRDGLPSQITERLGDIRSLFNWVVGYGFCDGDHIVGLRCYEDTTLGFYSTGIAKSCTYNTISTEEFRAAPLVRVFPQPATEQINIEVDASNNHQVQLLNLHGQLLFSTDFQSTLQIDVQHYPKGAYLLLISSEKTSYAIRKIYID